MNRQTFLTELENALAGRLPAAEVRDILSDYDEFIATGIAEGSSENDVTERLGDPTRIAQSLLSPEPAPEGSQDGAPKAASFANAPVYRRLLAFVVDDILMGLPFLWVASKLAVMGWFFPQYVPAVSRSFLGTIRISSHTWIVAARPFWLAADIAAIYWFFLLTPVCLTLFRGQTIGKRMFSLRVVANSGRSANVGQYLARELLGKLALNALFGMVWAPLAFIPALASLVWSLASQSGMTIWDAIAGTRVVEAAPRREEA